MCQDLISLCELFNGFSTESDARHGVMRPDIKLCSLSRLFDYDWFTMRRRKFERSSVSHHSMNDANSTWLFIRSSV